MIKRKFNFNYFLVALMFVMFPIIIILLSVFVPILLYYLQDVIILMIKY